MDLLTAHRSAMRQFGNRVRAVREEQWAAPTPDPEWSVRELIDHLVTEQLWAPGLLAGRTVEDITASADFATAGGNLGENLSVSWASAADLARRAVTGLESLDTTVHLSAGDMPAHSYIEQMTLDLAVHSWDLSRAIGVDSELPEDLLGFVLGLAQDAQPHWQGSSMFGPPVDVPADSDALTSLLGLTGRERDWEAA